MFCVTGLLPLGIISCAVRIAVAQDPCLEGNALELNHMPKRSSSYKMDSVPLCDRYIAEGWYRPIGYIMTTSPPFLTYCGTLYPVWMSEAYPLVGENKTLKACEVGFSTNCIRSYEVDVKNCTNFLVYKLKALDVCNSAYCFELHAHDDCINETVSDIKVTFHEITWTKKQKQQDGGQGVIKHDPSINLLCSFTPLDDDTLLYHIDWYVDNDIVIQGQTVDKESLKNATLSAEDMINAGKKINSWIHCTVGVKKSQSKYPCFSKTSYAFFAGIEVLNHTLTIERKGKAICLIRPTIPFAAETIETQDGQQSTSVLDIQLSFPGDASCKQQSDANLQECSVAINSYTYNERQKYEDPNNWRKIYKIEVFNTDDEGYYLSDHQLVLRLETNSASGAGAQIFANALFHDVLLNIVDTQNGWKGKRCSSFGDPYITTFDGYWYPCQQTGCAAGKTYILYRNEEHLQEVQVMHEDCWDGSCLCAVAVRAGLDVFTIDFCRGRQFINFLVCREDSLKVIKKQDTIYEIIFPTGTFVRARILHPRFQTFSFRINTEVYPSIADVNRTSGLCGNMDSSIINDLRRRDGTHDNIIEYGRKNPPDGFSLSWQLPVGSTEDLLSYSPDVYNRLENLSSKFHKLCTCDEEQTRCSYKQYNECKTKLKGKEYYCRLHSSLRKKRDLNHLTSLTLKKLKHQKIKRFKRQMYSEIDAFNICSEAFQNSNYFSTCLQNVPTFSNETLVNCISDIIITENLDVVWWHLNAALGQCQTYIQLNSSFQIDNPSVTTTIVNLCQNNCSEKGVCYSGTCKCDHGYGGSDCSFDVRSPPTITRLSDDGLCDKSEESCDDITLYGHYFVENMGTTCYFTREQRNEYNSIVSATSYSVNLEENTLYEGYCSLQYGPETPWITIFRFNLSNDKAQYSENYTVYVYQSECQNFHNDSGVISFTLQSGYCFIKGTCIQRGVMKSNDSCWMCTPLVDVYDWTWVSECDIKDTSESSMTKTTDKISNTQSAVTENYDNFSNEEKRIDSTTISLIVAASCITFLAITVGIVIKQCRKSHNSKTLNLYTSGPYEGSTKTDGITCIATKGLFPSTESMDIPTPKTRSSKLSSVSSMHAPFPYDDISKINLE